jgi:hypothetical protein
MPLPLCVSRAWAACPSLSVPPPLDLAIGYMQRRLASIAQKGPPR